jgi:hypothetical protein
MSRKKAEQNTGTTVIIVENESGRTEMQANNSTNVNVALVQVLVCSGHE